MSQGLIGFILTLSLLNEFNRRGLGYSVVTILTHVLIDTEDPAFSEPTKPIGPFYSEKDAFKVNR